MLPKQYKYIDVDQRKNPLMTKKTLKYYCQKEGLFTTPELNQKLYMQFKGFLKIVPQALSQYYNLRVLWLNNNGISKIQGLDILINLTSLALNNNAISKIQGLDNLHNLTVLNLSHNKIEIVEGISNLRKLQNFNLAHNFLSNNHSIEELSTAENLSTLNLSQNQLENTQNLFQSIVQNKKLACLYLKNTPFSRGFRNYRKKFTAYLKHLKYLDDRPITSQEHRLAQAWLSGGIEGQRQIKQKISLEKSNINEELMFLKIQSQIKLIESKGLQFASKAEYKMPNEQSFQKDLFINDVLQQNFLDQKGKSKIESQQEQQNKISFSNYYQNIQSEIITAKVQQILGRQYNNKDQYDKYCQKIKLKWKPKYKKILQMLLLRYKFDFSEVQPSFNMILADINKKMMRSAVRFQIEELRMIWTEIQKQKREVIMKI